MFHSAFVPPPKDVTVNTSSFLASNIAGGSQQEQKATARDGPDRLFAAENSNVKMAFNVYQTAVEEVILYLKMVKLCTEKDGLCTEPMQLILKRA